MKVGVRWEEVEEETEEQRTRRAISEMPRPTPPVRMCVHDIYT